uniref:Uncharacterized protein n=1 Tax=Arundo donax TaxID=35708 RepID=A0A0A9G4Y2_ARUDO
MRTYLGEMQNQRHLLWKAPLEPFILLQDSCKREDEQLNSLIDCPTHVCTDLEAK